MTQAGGRGVVVLGMHRSGTSAVTGLLHLAGVPLPEQRHLVGRGRFNPKGFWEIQPLNIVNESLLRALGGDWSAPPRLDAGWTEDPAVRGMNDRARKVFSKVMPSGAWLWKDPRLCLTLPFWRGIAEAPAVVMVLRNPLEIARSLADRNQFPLRLSLALWERYTAGMLAVAAGSPVAVYEYQSVFGDPAGWVRTAREWLIGLGVRCGAMAPEHAITDLIDPGLRHGDTSGALRDDPEASPQRIALLERTLAVRGFHDVFETPELPGLTPAGVALIQERAPTRRDVHRRHRWRKAMGKRAGRLVRRRGA